MQQNHRLHHDHSMETQVSVVPQGSPPSLPATHQTSSESGHGGGDGQVRRHPGHTHGRQDQVRRLEAFRRGRPQVGELSAGAQQTLQQSWAENTQSNYGLGFRYYTQYCRAHHLDESAPSSTNLINFLQAQFEEGKQYRTINSYRSAVFSTLGTCPVLGRPIGQDPLVSRFMRGVLRQRPPKNKLFLTWDVTSVLNHLKSWGETKSLPLKKLLMKTAFLLALVCYKRPADLCNMQVHRGYWQLSMRGFSCQPLGFGKTEIHNAIPHLPS